MPKTINCGKGWPDDLIKDTVIKSTEAFLNALRGKMMFKFIGKETTVTDIASNIFQITSGKQFIGKFQIIDDPSEGKILKIEYEKSGKKAKSLLWNNLFNAIEPGLNKSPEEMAEKFIAENPEEFDKIIDEELSKIKSERK
ncbi:MAG: hypothetical protein ACFFCE_14475 [Promethearchaeota archaeon]